MSHQLALHTSYCDEEFSRPKQTNRLRSASNISYARRNGYLSQMRLPQIDCANQLPCSVATVHSACAGDGARRLLDLNVLSCNHTSPGLPNCHASEAHNLNQYESFVRSILAQSLSCLIQSVLLESNKSFF